MSRLRPVTLMAVLALLVALVGVPGVVAAPKGPVNVQLLGINDFHGNLEPPAGSSGRIGTVNAGGVEYLSTHIAALEADNPYTVVLSAGDLIGASPLISALFHDEPTIEAMNLIGLDVNAVGNHEFDEGIDELIRMQEGGCHPVDGCQDGDAFSGADFRFLAANVVWKKNGKTVFPAYKMYSFDGAKIAVVGLVTRTTPTIVTPSGISALDFLDEADTMNALIPELKKKGIETVVGLIHEGGFPTGAYNECPGISGAIVDIVDRADDEVDLWISGHTHQGYNCVIDGDPRVERQLVRAHRDRHRHDDRSRDRRADLDPRRQQDRHPRCHQGFRADEPHREVQDAVGAAREPRRRQHHRRHHPRAECRW